MPNRKPINQRQPRLNQRFELSTPAADEGFEVIDDSDGEFGGYLSEIGQPLAEAISAKLASAATGSVAIVASACAGSNDGRIATVPPTCSSGSVCTPNAPM